MHDGDAALCRITIRPLVDVTVNAHRVHQFVDVFLQLLYLAVLAAARVRASAVPDGRRQRRRRRGQDRPCHAADRRRRLLVVREAAQVVQGAALMVQGATLVVRRAILVMPLSLRKWSWLHHCVLVVRQAALLVQADSLVVRGTGTTAGDGFIARHHRGRRGHQLDLDVERCRRRRRVAAVCRPRYHL